MTSACLLTRVRFPHQVGNDFQNDCVLGFHSLSFWWIKGPRWSLESVSSGARRESPPVCLLLGDKPAALWLISNLSAARRGGMDEKIKHEEKGWRSSEQLGTSFRISVENVAQRIWGFWPESVRMSHLKERHWRPEQLRERKTSRASCRLFGVLQAAWWWVQPDRLKLIRPLTPAALSSSLCCQL